MKIEKGIPIPKCDRSHWWAVLIAMTPGDSFRVETDRERLSILRCAQRYGVPVTSRKLDGNGYRVWRLTTKQIKESRDRRNNWKVGDIARPIFMRPGDAKNGLPKLSVGRRRD